MVLFSRVLVQEVFAKRRRSILLLAGASLCNTTSHHISSSSFAAKVAAVPPAIPSPSSVSPSGAKWSSRGAEDKDYAQEALKWTAGIFGCTTLLALGIPGTRNYLAFGEAALEIEEIELPRQQNVFPLKTKTNFFLTESYRRRVFFNYERRIRARSPPEKVFEYFASVREIEGQSFMTAGDLMRAIVPVFPPSESPLIREGYLAGERKPGELQCAPSEFFMLFDTNGDGLITFQEYIFLMTLLSIPENNFYATFKMFDRDGNGMIDKDEFKKVMEVMQAQTRQGIAQRDGRRSLGTKRSGSVENCRLLQLFFGEDGKKNLSFADFEQFLHGLHEEITRLEFSHYDFHQRGTMSARDFGLSMVAAADMSSINQYLERAEFLGYNPRFNGVEISYQEFRQFAELRKQLPMLAVAISSFGKSHGLLTQSDFQRAASQVCNVPVTDTVVDIVFHIFDLNNDGTLSMEEFLGVLQRRERGVADPVESGLAKIFKCLFRCAQNHNCQIRWISI
ncbi:hypothetical protein O6H91_03G053900 [Diphasiastrum complanatum]|uniref:Uncharacterized protein n=1 Tax=Diphasiastrum complanatum TaxID=34168 RepID=A0ACC2E6C8_DIPCM|nr:hypothetical protein O6H91_03G053900 [Diphasiastrum complanatum]